MKRNTATLNIVLSVALACCLAVIVLLSVALMQRPTLPADDPTDGTVTTDATTATTATQPGMLRSEDGKRLLIGTPYGTLAFPAEYEDYLKYETASVNGVGTVYTFFCVTDATETALYRIAFDAPDTGVCVGFLRDGERDVPVTVVYPEQSFAEDRPLERAMAETVNDLLAFLREDGRFVDA